MPFPLPVRRRSAAQAGNGSMLADLHGCASKGTARRGLDHRERERITAEQGARVCCSSWLASHGGQ